MKNSLVYGAEECLCEVFQGKRLDSEIVKTCKDLRFALYRGTFDQSSKIVQVTWLVEDLHGLLGDFSVQSDNYFDIIANNIHPDDKVLTNLFLENLLSRNSFTREYRLLLSNAVYRTFTEYVTIISRVGDVIHFAGSIAPIAVDINSSIKHDAIESGIRDKLREAEGIFGWRMQDGYIHCNSSLYELMNFDRQNKKIKLIDFLRAIEPGDRAHCMAEVSSVFRRKKRAFSINVRLKATRRISAKRADKMTTAKRICICGLAIDFSKHFNPIVIVGSAVREGDIAKDYLRACADRSGRRDVYDHTGKLENELLLTKKAEEQLVANLKKEQDLNKVKSLFVNMVSHEMRTPLAIIQGVADLLENCSGQLSDIERKNYIQSIKKSVLRLTRTMDSILILGKVQSNQLCYRALKADLVQFCKNIINELEELNEGRKIILQISKFFPRELEIDTTLLYHIVSNLLNNAIKYSEADKVVELNLAYDNNNLILYVKDHGIGIPHHEIKDMFKLFHRGSNVANRKGIGLGMFIIKHCVALYRGSIEVESKENIGTVFKVTLPIAS